MAKVGFCAKWGKIFTSANHGAHFIYICAMNGWSHEIFIVFVITAAALVIQLLYFFLVFVRVWTFRHKQPDDDMSATPVSVVIAARNEADNLKELIPLLYEQDHPDFEVVVVNDRSWDSTKEVLKALVVQYPDLHVIHIEEHKFNQFSGKKFAITLGIKGAKEDVVVLTDADCRPANAAWLRHISGGFTREARMVLGYSPEKHGKGLVGLLSKWDSAYTGMQYLGYALAGIPYMGVGRNLAYEIELFYETSGFKSHYSLPSGDDDLFVNEAARLTRPHVVFHKDAHVHTKAPENLKTWWLRKRRHLTTSTRYRVIHKLLLITYPFTMLLWLAGSLLLMLNPDTIWFGVVSLGVRILLQMTVFAGVFSKLRAGYAGLAAPLLEPLYLGMLSLIHLANLFKPNRAKAWK